MSYKKVPLRKFGDGTLVATVSTSSTLSDEEVDDLLFSASYQLLAFDGEPAAGFEKLETSFKKDEEAHNEEEEEKTPPLVGCLVASAAKAQYYASVLIPAPNVAIIQQALNDHREGGDKVFEAWEVQFAQGVLPFVQDYNLAAATKLLQKACATCPFNALASRTLFLMHYLTADFAAMKADMLAVLQAYPTKGDMDLYLKREKMLKKNTSEGSWLVEPHLAQIVAFACDEIGEKEEAQSRTESTLAVAKYLRANNTKIQGRDYTHSYLTHTFCHIHEHNPAKVLEVVKETEELWIGTNLLAPHVYWHKILCLYMVGDMETALKEYDYFVGKFLTPKTADVFVLADCVGFLWRATLDGLLPMDDQRVKDCVEQWQHQAMQQAQGVVANVPRLSQVPFFDIHFRCAQLMEVLGSKKQDAQDETVEASCGQEYLAKEWEQLKNAKDDAKAGRVISEQLAEATLVWMQRHQSQEAEVRARKGTRAVELLYDSTIENPKLSLQMGGSNAQRGILVHSLVAFAATSQKEDGQSTEAVKKWFDAQFTAPHGQTNPQYGILSKTLNK